MFEIVEDVKIEMDNVLSIKGEFTQQDIPSVVKDIKKIISDSGASENGRMVTATYSVDSDGTMDMEILVPLDKEIVAPAGYEFKPIFRLRNAIKVVHRGDPALLQESADELMKHIENRGLMQITVGYSVLINSPANMQNLEDYCSEIYVGVCDNVL